MKPRMEYPSRQNGRLWHCLKLKRLGGGDDSRRPAYTRNKGSRPPPVNNHCRIKETLIIHQQRADEICYRMENSDDGIDGISSNTVIKKKRRSNIILGYKGRKFEYAELTTTHDVN